MTTLMTEDGPIKLRTRADGMHVLGVGDERLLLDDETMRELGRLATARSADDPDPDPDDHSLADVVEQRLDEGWRPKASGSGDPGDAWSEYAWGIVPCPHCDTGMLIGVHDPAHRFEGEDVSLATFRPPEEVDGDDD